MTVLRIHLSTGTLSTRNCDDERRETRVKAQNILCRYFDKGSTLKKKKYSHN